MLNLKDKAHDHSQTQEKVSLMVVLTKYTYSKLDFHKKIPHARIWSHILCT